MKEKILNKLSENQRKTYNQLLENIREHRAHKDVEMVKHCHGILCGYCLALEQMGFISWNEKLFLIVQGENEDTV